MSNDDSPFQTIDSRIAFECAWYRVRQDAIVLPNGSVGQYNVVEAPECVFIVPVTRDRQIVLIYQYRYPTQEWTWEIPAGAVHAGQSLLEAAAIELREEIGGTSDDFRYLGRVATANGRANEIAHLYLAFDVELGESAHESAEVMTIHPLPIEEVIRRVYDNEIQDAPSALALLMAAPHLKRFSHP